MAIYDKELFGEQVVAWKHGPVIPSIYQEFKRFRSDPIIGYAMDFEFEDENGKVSYPVVDRDDDDTFTVLDAVWESYKNKSGWELRNITHQDGTPWQSAKGKGYNQPLDRKEIKERATKAILQFEEVPVENQNGNANA